MAALKKLEIVGYKDNAFSIGTDNSFTVMVNPSSYKELQGVRYNEEKAMDGGNTPTYQGYIDEEIEFEFMLDNSGVLINWKEAANHKKEPLSKTLETLRKTVYEYDGDKHEPPFLKVAWGTLNFKGRLKKLDVDYVLQNAEGEPVRAIVRLCIVKYIDQETQNKEKNKSSPDLSHLVTVKAGDTLPMLCLKIYKSAAYCAEVARVNNLTGFRNITPGMQLFFPPLANE